MGASRLRKRGVRANRLQAHRPQACADDETITFNFQRINCDGRFPKTPLPADPPPLPPTLPAVSVSTIALVIADLVGHFHSTVAIARRLENRGHRAVYLGPGTMEERIREQGFAFEAAPFLEPFPGGGVTRSWRHPVRERRRRRALAERLTAAPRAAEELVRRVDPDLVIFDPFLLMYSVLFLPLGIPAVALSTKPLLDWDPRVPPYTSPLVPGPGLAGLLRVQAAWAARWLRYAGYKVGNWLSGRLAGHTAYDLTAVMARATGFPLRREWSMRPVPFDFRFRSVPEVVLWAREMDLPRSLPLRLEVRYAGPCASLERQEPPFDAPEVPSGGRLVLASLGTVDPLGDPRTLRFLGHLAEAFRQRPGDILVLATGRELPPEVRSSWPPNVHPRPYVPQVAALRRASLFITHGGASSLKEAVLLGVPVLVYPRRADQPGNAARAVFHRLGLAGDPGRDRAADVLRKMDRILGDPAFTAGVLEMRQLLLRYATQNTAVEVFESFLIRKESGERR